MITVTTTKIAPTDTAGEKIRVAGLGHQLTVPWDYAQRDMHLAAVQRWLAVYGGQYAGWEVRWLANKARGFRYELVAPTE